jgi:hypothetical protein
VTSCSQPSVTITLPSSHIYSRVSKFISWRVVCYYAMLGTLEFPSKLNLFLSFSFNEALFQCHELMVPRTILHCIIIHHQRTSCIINLMMLLLKTVSNSRKGTGFPFLVPAFQPVIGADGVCVLPQGSTLGFISGLLGADEPLIVSIPAVKGLVLSRETLVTRSSTSLLDHGEDGTLLLVHLRNRLAEDL